MSNYIALLALLSQKQALFLEIEEITSHMSLQEVDALVESMERRGNLLNIIADLDIQLKESCATDNLLQQAINHECRKTDLPINLAPIYDLSLSIKGIIMRIGNNDETIRIHLDFEKERILSKIQQLNQSSGVVADRYHRSMTTGNHLSAKQSKNTLI